MTSSDLYLGFIFILGCLIGSYLAVVIDRYGTKRSANSGRSTCNHCHRTLATRDLMPLFSYLLLGGRCRFCYQPIGWQNFVIELMAGVGAVFIFWQIGLSWVALGLAMAFWIGLVIFWIDLRDYLIPDGAVLALLGATLVVRLGAFSTLESGLMGALVGTGILGSLVFITGGRGMGLGDVKLALPLGLLLGWPGILLGLFMAFILGSLVGVGLILAHRRGWRDAVPFGPFLLVGATLAMIWGDSLLTWYLGRAFL